ncbi:MAG: alpha/beta fold hydrolase [Acidimicrobiales bacterium]
MHVQIEGEGPPLVLIHSLLTDAAAFDDVASSMAQKRCVVRVSLPGFAGTPPLEGDDLTIADLAEAVAEAMDAADLGPDTAVLGNGLGSFVALSLAVQHGERFGPLIAANSGATFPDERKGAFTNMSGAVADGGMGAVVDVAVKRIFPEPFANAHPNMVDERREVIMRTEPHAFAAACRALRELDLRPDLGAITNPTLVIAGGADATTPPEMSDDLVAGIPGAEFSMLDGCGHCPQLEQPSEFVREIEAFLDRVA